MAPPHDIDDLSAAALKAMVINLLSEVHEQKQVIAGLREEIARLKGLKGPPTIKPSGMEAGTGPKRPGSGRSKRRRGKASKRIAPEERILKAEAPAGSRFKGYEQFLVQDLVLRAEAVLYRRERWVSPDGRTILAPLPAGIIGHFGPELHRFVLNLYPQGQVTVPRLAAQLHAIGIDISKRQIVRLLLEAKEDFRDEARAVLRAGLANADWVSVDDTGARHKGANGYWTQIGNDHFTSFATTRAKSRLNFLALLRAGHDDFAITAAAQRRSAGLYAHTRAFWANHSAVSQRSCQAFR